ncbi:acyl-CoA thioesterase [Flavobacteriales bacterium]|jgi:acyl-CoA thioester hydrolase|nr:acyl-CoA thioesterase [Flavobacteriales bacterium]
MNKNTSHINIRVRYAETDKMGFVYYGNYATYYEVARVEWLRERGYSYKVMEDEGIMLPVVHFSIDYKRPAFYDELLTIEIELVEEPANKLVFRQQVMNEKGKVLNTSKVVLVGVNAETMKPIRFPEAMAKAIYFPGK